MKGLRVICLSALLLLAAFESGAAKTLRADPAASRAKLANRVVQAFNADKGTEAPAEEAPVEDAALEEKIKAKEGADSAAQFHSLDSKKEEIDRMVKDLKAREASATDETEKAQLRAKREKIEEIEQQMDSHFQALNGLFALNQEKAVGHKKGKKAKQEYTPPRELCPFGYGTGCGGGGGAGLSQATKDQVANILKGIISNLSNKRGSLTAISAQLIKDEGLHQAKNAEVKKALLGLLSAFSKDQKATSEVVSKLTEEKDGKKLSALAAVSSALTKMQPLQEPTKHTPRGKWQPLTTDKPSPKAPPAGPIVKK